MNDLTTRRCDKILNYIQSQYQTEEERYKDLTKWYQNLKSELQDFNTVYQIYYEKRPSLPYFIHSRHNANVLFDVNVGEKKEFLCLTPQKKVFFNVGSKKPYLQNRIIQIGLDDFIFLQEEYTTHSNKYYWKQINDKLPLKTKNELLQLGLETVEDYITQFYNYIDNLGVINND